VLLLVIHTWPEESEEGEPVGRIISARKATAAGKSHSIVQNRKWRATIDEDGQ
jgi:hypothetical protein